MVITQRTGNDDDYKVRVHVKRPNENLIAQLDYDFYDIQNNNKAQKKRVEYNYSKSWGYGSPAIQYCASRMFEISIVWEEAPNNQVQCALVGNDVTDKLAYVHEPSQPIKILNPRDEHNLTQPAPIPLGNLKDQKEFEELVRNKNPVTGEVNGPKEDPLKHGSDWSY
ncbi:6151_t:CDS:2, partial [Entrophospora sp. SA101]